MFFSCSNARLTSINICRTSFFSRRGTIKTSGGVPSAAKKKFATVSGLETIDAWEVDWPVLENPDISFCNPRKAALMSQLHSRLREISKMPQQSDDFKGFHYEFVML
jgi:hypothetical protein